MKRKLSDAGDQPPVSTPKRRRTALEQSNGALNSHAPNAPLPNGDASHELPPSERDQSTPKKASGLSATPLQQSGLKTPTHKSKARGLFATPTKPKSAVAATPSRVKNADRSVRKKSARVLFEQDEDAAWDGSERLAEEILQGDEPDTEKGQPLAESIEPEGGEEAPEKGVKQPKRRAGRPKGARNKRSPTPEGELPAHERYFFQNRAGPVKTSNATLNKVPLLTHEEYFEKLGQYEDPCKEEKEYLQSLHHRSFPQWAFEFDEGFNICLFGYGSKRKLVDEFAEWIYNHRLSATMTPTIVMVNGYTPGISIRSIFATIVTAVMGDDAPSKLGAQPTEVLELLQSALKSHKEPVTVLINSIDAPPLRRAANQALLSRLAATPLIRLLVTADTPNFPVMWDISLRDQFNFVFHDCTTFLPFSVEADVVEEVNALLGRKGRRVGGKDGVGFVLKSLPENARNLYRLLLTELITLLDDGHQSDDEGATEGGKAGDDTGIEFRLLYQKATEEFVASSEMMFRTLLKEFHDHQMITSRMDASGMEILGVPLSRDEMEGVLEDLVLG
ncbi:Origin recognition complex, subunit 2 [Penicillium griseofulvum]|uniref:Origin recognition complex subunit 2 n=1 Tax=Penicillium patulum TaxID=5078 RepID=A0A135LLW3_PENPA|nr:Origin recognition complex, subunit 2 [Penicillium griseofulvum]KXG49959.1 Origin recognition complex, subunit 2 [Penicillium griseofulvum]